MTVKAMTGREIRSADHFLYEAGLLSSTESIIDFALEQFRINGADLATWNVNRISGDQMLLLHGKLDPVPVEAVIPHFNALVTYVGQHPNIQLLKKHNFRLEESLNSSDLMSPQDFWKTDLYQDVYRHIESRYHLTLNFQIGPELYANFNITRAIREFKDHDVTLFDYAAQGLKRIIRRRIMLDQNNTYLAFFNTLNTDTQSTVFLESDLRTQTISPATKDLFRFFFSESIKDKELPTPVLNWLIRLFASKSYRGTTLLQRREVTTFQRHKRILIALLQEQLPGPKRSLVFMEDPEAKAKYDTLLRILTRRQRQVFELQCDGLRSKAEIAAKLQIAPRTVETYQSVVNHHTRELGMM